MQTNKTSNTCTNSTNDNLANLLQLKETKMMFFMALVLQEQKQKTKSIVCVLKGVFLQFVKFYFFVTVARKRETKTYEWFVNKFSGINFF